nr:PREDICTED: uncharacterized protein LOC657715 isoform X2 [Tribolium castaneum]|eukprot:XP_008191233.1 PREDICTED: uncharacterized protein LOC657715 isoform X2 [Tribolium castaneum]
MLRPILLLLLIASCRPYRKRPEDKTKCPSVKAIRNFNLEQMMGRWYVIQYYASSEEALSYSFTDDPLNELLVGNITWTVPNPGVPSHWTHSEDTYEGVYNTFVLDSDYTSWALLLHCAEKSKVPRYLSSFIMSREPVLGVNVISYLRDKLPRYDIDLSYMFEMSQNDCNSTVIASDLPPALVAQRLPPSLRRHPMKHHH